MIDPVSLPSSSQLSFPPGGTEAIVVSVDAMGADFAPAMAVKSCLLALEQHPELSVRLFGDPVALEPAIKAIPDSLKPRLELIATDQTIAMESSPAQALRRGGQSSMALGLDSIAIDSNTLDDSAASSRPAQAFVSAGNTGALMALACSRLGTLPGIERPALMTAFPVRGGQSWVLDLGANIGVDADRLFEFALLGSAAVSALNVRLDGGQPKVGLLNIGEESNKGPDVVREAARRLQQSDLNYIGFVEGHTVFSGVADVIVCDGFAGNILLKSAEGSISMLLNELNGWRSSWLLRWLLKDRIERLQQRYDPGVHNGASLLGINGIVVKSHAHADAKALAKAIALAAFEVQRGLLPELERQLWAGS